MLNIALLENIHPEAVALFQRHQLDAVRTYPKSFEGQELKEILGSVNLLGIRSKTQITREMLEAAPNLLAIGCFCIGTDQVDLAAAKEKGIAVFNAPYANTRSVAELVLGEVIMLMRRIPEKDKATHRGEWLKEVAGASEVRGKTLGIIGYGHIGTQLSILAEAIGMRVAFYDIVDKLALGNATKLQSLDQLLSQADIVTLHVPATLETEHMIGAKEIAMMKPGGLLINASRGSVVDLDALARAITSGHIGGAAIDVFPVEPSAKGDVHITPLQNLSNVILTPHIGGSTLEAQENIAADVAEKLLRYALHGSTGGSVNLPQVVLSPAEDHIRFRHFHRNVPGILAQVNDVFSSRGLNIAAQYLQTDKTHGYVVIDSDTALDHDEILDALTKIPGTIRAF